MKYVTATSDDLHISATVRSLCVWLGRHDEEVVHNPSEELFLGYLFLTVESEREESKTIYIPS